MSMRQLRPRSFGCYAFRGYLNLSTGIPLSFGQADVVRNLATEKGSPVTVLLWIAAIALIVQRKKNIFGVKEKRDK